MICKGQNRISSLRGHYLNGMVLKGISYLTKMVPSSPELSRVLPSHWPDLLSYCCPVGAIVGPGHRGGEEDAHQGHHGFETFCIKGDNGTIAWTTGRALVHSTTLQKPK